MKQNKTIQIITQTEDECGCKWYMEERPLDKVEFCVKVFSCEKHKN